MHGRNNKECDKNNKTRQQPTRRQYPKKPIKGLASSHKLKKHIPKKRALKKKQKTAAKMFKQNNRHNNPNPKLPKPSKQNPPPANEKRLRKRNNKLTNKHSKLSKSINRAHTKTTRIIRGIYGINEWRFTGINRLIN